MVLAIISLLVVSSVLVTGFITPSRLQTEPVRVRSTRGSIR